MQNFPAINFITTGGSNRVLGFSPIASNSALNGLHHLFSVLRLTPALSANCCFVIAFIIVVILIVLQSNYFSFAVQLVFI